MRIGNDLGCFLFFLCLCVLCPYYIIGVRQMECIFAFCCDKGIANSLQMFFSCNEKLDTFTIKDRSNKNELMMGCSSIQ